MRQGVVVGVVVLAVSFIPRDCGRACGERQDSNLHNLAVIASVITLDRRPIRARCGKGKKLRTASANFATLSIRAVACAGLEPALSRLRDGRRCQLD